MLIEGREYFPDQEKFESACRSVMNNEPIDGDPKMYFMLDRQARSGNRLMWRIGISQKTGRRSVMMTWTR